MDPVSQRHEKTWNRNGLRYLHEHDVNVYIHCHDRNVSINKYVRENTEAMNQNDIWHCVKLVNIALKKCQQVLKNLRTISGMYRYLTGQNQFLHIFTGQFKIDVKLERNYKNHFEI